MGETRGAHSIDIAINFEGEPSKPCIFKVPDILRSHSPKSFVTPYSFSIGPIHYQKKKCPKEQKKAKKIKEHYLKNLLTRKPTLQMTREDIKRSILEVEEKARQCYDVPFVHISKDKFVDILILDGCFIIEFLRNNEITSKKNDYDKNNNSSSNINKNNINTTLDKDDPVFRVSWVRQVLYHDLILLDNQIPWFVLVRLFDMTTTISGSTKSLTDLALSFLRPNFSECPLPQIEGSHKINHIIDLLRNPLVSSFGIRQESTERSTHKSNKHAILKKISSFATGQVSEGEWQVLPTATSLKELGIRFEKVQSSQLLNIDFVVEHGVLKIPSLIIRETTCEMLRNLISYEQCYPNCKPEITSYSILLNNLINTTKDIEVLHDTGIVVNYLNPNDALDFFKNIYIGTFVEKFSYNDICREVKKYTDRWWPGARAAYVRNHFAEPWVIVSQIAAGIFTILTFLQTWYTMK